MIRTEFKEASNKVKETLTDIENMSEEKKAEKLDGVAVFAVTLAMGMLGGSTQGEEEVALYDELEERFLRLGLEM